MFLYCSRCGLTKPKAEMHLHKAYTKQNGAKTYYYWCNPCKQKAMEKYRAAVKKSETTNF